MNHTCNAAAVQQELPLERSLKRPVDMTEEELDEYMKIAPQAVALIRSERARKSRPPEGSFVLDEARTVVYGPRESSYGPPTKNFEDIAAGWSVILGTPVTVGQFGLMMAWLKICRAKAQLSPDLPGVDRNRIQDSMVDIAGYAEATMRALFEEPPV